MDVFSIALRGLDQAQMTFDHAARNLVPAGGAAPGNSPTDSVNLSDAALSLISARIDVETNLQTLKVAGGMDRQAIDLLAGRTA
jgi:hypothetical protein